MPKGLKLGLAALGLVAGLWASMPTPVAAQASFAGVHIDADRVLRMQYVPDPDGSLMRQRIAAAKAGLDPDVAKASPLRKISLNRLEAAIEKSIADGKPITEELKYLAGLQRLQYVFYYPDTKDIVIAGPAEGWVLDPVNTARGLSNGRPVLLLEDLVVALRSFPAGGKNNAVIGCSIDPTTEGLQRMQQFLMKIGAAATPDKTQFIVQGLRQSLGLQTVTVMGVPANTHFAQVLVEADYRMKLIGIGLEQPAVKMASYVDLVNPSAVSRNAMQRWYFTPNYDCVRVSEDNLGMELVGNGVKLINEDELVAENGQRGQAASSNAASSKFVQGFTKSYPDLADKTPVYAQLRNLIDLSIAAAYIQDQDYYEQSGWKMLVLGNEKLFEVETHDTPEKVESAVNSLWKGRVLMTPIGGGVEIRAKKALADEAILADEGGKVRITREQVRLDVTEGQWWWD